MAKVGVAEVILLSGLLFGGLVNSVKGRFFTSGTVRVSLRGASLWEGWLLGGKSHCWRIRNPSAVSASEIEDAANKGDCIF